MNKVIREFNSKWEKKEIDKPIIILIGGAAGSGKSTLGKKLNEDIGFSNVLQTPIIRTLMNVFMGTKNLERHTFDLVEEESGLDMDRRKKLLIDEFVRQCSQVENTVSKFIDFISSEKQHYIIEGSNILPNYDWNISENYLLIEIYLYVSDEKQHRVMFSAPTHNRLLDNNRLTNLRLLNDFIKEEAVKNNKLLFDYSANYNIILETITEKVKEFYKL